MSSAGDTVVRNLASTHECKPYGPHAAGAIRLFGLASLCLALIPVARTSYVVATTGADCISNDDILFVSLTEGMLGGAYDWRGYFHDTFINGHCAAALQALLLGLGPLTAWNQYSLCFTGIAMAAVRAHLTASFLSFNAPRLYLPALAIVSWLIFSFSQISIFTSGIFAVTWQACLLFLTAGAYLLLRFPHKLRAAIAASALGIMASWILSVALPGWLLYLTLLLSRARTQWASIVTVTAGAAVAFLPYACYLKTGTDHSRRLSEQLAHSLDLRFFVNALGRAFANDTGSKFGPLPDSEFAGVLGLAAFTLLCGAMLCSARLRATLAPCFAWCAWSMLVLAVISMTRPGIAPWYALISAIFWSGAAAACALLAADLIGGWTRSRDGRARNGGGRTQERGGWTQERGELLRNSAALVSCLVLLTVAAWSLKFNRSYLDKQYYLENRTPVSASVLRNYDIAPESFASYVFKLPGLSAVVTGTILKRNRWSVFSTNQTWEMQGDSIFSLSSGYTRGVELNRSAWITGKNRSPIADFRSPKHLNLCVSSHGSATWRVELPASAKRITLKTAVAPEKNAPDGGSASHWSASVQESELNGPSSKLSGLAARDWQQVRFDLSNYREKSVIVHFDNASDGAAVVFRYPVIEVRFD